MELILGLIEYIAILATSYGFSFWYPVTWIRMHVEGTYILEDKFAEWFPNYNKE